MIARKCIHGSGARNSCASTGASGHVWYKTGGTTKAKASARARYAESASVETRGREMNAASHSANACSAAPRNSCARSVTPKSQLDSAATVVP